jgi:hypothetical protein
MTDAGSGLWKATIPMLVGDVTEYKFQLDQWAVAEEFVGGESCTVTDPSGQYINRILTVEAGDPNLDVVCFASCEPCAVGIDENDLNVSIAPNPFNTEIEISASADMKSIRLLDMSGKEVLFTLSNGNSKKLNLESLKAGVYTVVVETESSISTSRIIKK